MNHFFALELPEKARTQAAAFAERWQRQVDPLLRARWVAPEDYHVTLKFLGPISTPAREYALHAGARLAARQQSVTLEQKPAVLFPALAKPHVLWIEMVLNDPLHLLATGLELSFRAVGVPPDHRLYKPHLTLARCRPEPDAKIDPVPLTEQVFVAFTVNHFALMQTLPPEARVKGQQMRYNIVHTFPFGKMG